jgi:excisionase family DNA binding protein
LEGEREMIESELLTSKEVINLLKISKSTLLRWVQNGKLPSHHVGSKLLRFKRDDVMSVLSKYEPSIKVDLERERIAKVKELKGICSHLPGGSLCVKSTNKQKRRKDFGRSKSRINFYF